MSTGAQYEHIIKHLETSHLSALPVPTVADAVAAEFLRNITKLLQLRNDAYRLTLDAEKRFEQAIGSLVIDDLGENGFRVRVTRELTTGRRRFDAAAHNPAAAAIRRHLCKHGKGFTAVTEAGYKIWLPSRFRRVPAEDGVWFLDSADLLEVNPDITKRIADSNFGDPHRGRVDAGWILMARSGQSYGIIGSAIVAGADLEGYVISDHVMRIKPNDNPKMKPGYLLTALTHPLLGRPLVKALAYGSSIPEIDVSDMEKLEVVRLSPAQELAIADLAEASAKARADADLLERAMARDAEKIIDRFISANPR
jgi:hypothetical protein